MSEEKRPTQHLPREIEMLTQPLTTEDGFINEACVNELEAVIKNMPDTAERMSGDSEWELPGHTFDKSIAGYLSNWIIQQSGGAPECLSNLINCLLTFMRAEVPKDLVAHISEQHSSLLLKVSLCQIASILETTLADIPDWCKLNDKDYMGAQDLDWIDLDACIRNVCTSIRDERRHIEAFERGFAKKYPDSDIAIDWDCKED